MSFSNDQRPQATQHKSFVHTCSKFTIFFALVAGAIFQFSPRIDISVAQIFYLGDGEFVAQRAAWVDILRWCFKCMFFVSLAAAIAGVLMSARRGRAWRLRSAEWVFLLVCLIVGPGLVANIVLKDHSGRARPKQIVEFGGDKAFTPPLKAANQCVRNCSFISGETASIFVPFYAAAAVVPEWSVGLVVLGTIAGLGAGTVRMAQGAHFLSDVLFAGIAMMLTVTSVYFIFLGVRWPRIKIDFTGSPSVGAATVTVAACCGGLLMLGASLYLIFWHPDWSGDLIVATLWPFYLGGGLLAAVGALYDRLTS